MIRYNYQSVNLLYEKLHNLEGLAQRLEFSNVLPFQLLSNLLKPFHRFYRVQAFSTSQADFRTDVHYRRMDPAFQQFFHIFLNHFTAASGTFFEGFHAFLLVQPSIQRSGWGR